MWIKVTMSELWDFLNEDISDELKRVIIKPKFPTRRWGNITTKDVTTDILSINKAIKKYKEKGIKARKRICKETGLKHPKFGKFYFIEIFKIANDEPK